MERNGMKGLCYDDLDGDCLAVVAGHRSHPLLLWRQ